MGPQQVYDAIVASLTSSAVFALDSDTKFEPNSRPTATGLSGRMDVRRSTLISLASGSGKTETFVLLASARMFVRFSTTAEDQRDVDQAFTPLRPQLLTAAEAVGAVACFMIMLARRVSSILLWRRLLTAVKRRMYATSWSADPPGHRVAASHRPPRGPNYARMTPSVIRVESRICLPA